MSIYSYPTEMFGANPSTGVQPNAAQAMAVGQNVLSTNQGLAGMYNQQNTDMGNQVAQQQKNAQLGMQTDQASILYPGAIQNALGQQQAENMALVGQAAGQVSGLLKGVPPEQRQQAFQQLLKTSPQLASNPLVQQIGQLSGDALTNSLDIISNHIAMANPQASAKAQLQYQQIAGQGANALNVATTQGQFGVQRSQIGANTQIQTANIEADVRKQVAQLQSNTDLQTTAAKIQMQKDLMGLQVEAGRYNMTPEAYLTSLARTGQLSRDQLVNALAYIRAAQALPKTIVGPEGLKEVQPLGAGGFNFGGNSPQQSSGPVTTQVNTQAQYDALPSGSIYTDSTGSTHRKP